MIQIFLAIHMAENFMRDIHFQRIFKIMRQMDYLVKNIVRTAEPVIQQGMLRLVDHGERITSDRTGYLQDIAVGV